MPTITPTMLNTGSLILPDMLYYGCSGPYIGNHSVETCFQRHPAELGLTYNPPPPVSPIAITSIDRIYKGVTASSLYTNTSGSTGGEPPPEG